MPLPAGVAVTETDKALLFQSGDTRLCTLRKPRPNDRVRSSPPVESAYYEALLQALDDPLARRLPADGERDFTTIAGLLAPVFGPAFVGDESVLERVEIAPDGTIPGFVDPPLPPESALTHIGLLDGWLPAPVHTYGTAEGTVEQIAFAAADEHGNLAVWRRLRRVPTTAGATIELCYQRHGAVVPAEEFYAALLELWQHWDAFRRQGLRLSLPEDDLAVAAQAMLQLGVLTFRGLWPRYGVGTYDQERHNSFPPATLFLTQALLCWGHLERAREVLSHYVSRYIKPDGTLDYYGPALAEYGQFLALIADYVRIADDAEWLRRRLTLVRPLWQRLLALRAESRQRYPAGDPHHGLIPGLPEADYHGMADQWQTFYYSGDVWACRGLREMGRVLMAQESSAVHDEGEALVAEAQAYERDIRESLRQTTDRAAGYVPPGPDQLTPLANLTQDQHASYCNYRYFPEMMSAGVLSSETVADLLQWRRTHGGELLGMTRFEGHLDDWPALHIARALLERDEADRYLLLLYGHWAHHSAAGTLASYEQVAIRPDDRGFRRVVAGQVLPCQVMVPIMLRWALVYEEREADVLWLCRAIPRRWLAPGSKLKVGRVPTRFGQIGFTVRVRTNGSLRVTLRLRKDPCAAQIKLRLRLPDNRRPRHAHLDTLHLPLRDDVIILPIGLSGKIRLDVE